MARRSRSRRKLPRCSTRRGTKVCISRRPIKGMRCGRAPNGLYACAQGRRRR